MIRLLNNYLRFSNYGLALYCAVGLVLMAGPLGCLVALASVALAVQARRRRLTTTLGSARWADEEDLKEAGMLRESSGLIIGRTQRTLTWRQRLTGKRLSLVRLHQAVHTAIYAPTGAGKGVSLVVPYLLSSVEPAVILDFKGELASLTARHRERVFGHRTVFVDPYQTFTQSPDSYNPLDSIGKDHPLAIDDCNDLANSIVVRTGRETEQHWADSAEAVIAAVAAIVVGYGETGTRSLQTIREIVSQPKMLDLAIKLMLESDKWNGALKPMGGQLLSFADKERASVLSSTLRHLRFLSTPAVAASVASSSFDPAELRNGRLTVYLILPPDRAAAQSGLLRIWVSSLLRACVRGGLR